MLSERRMLSLKTNHPNITKKAKKVKNSNSGCGSRQKENFFCSSVVKTFSNMKKTSEARKTPLAYISANSELKIPAVIQIRNLSQDTHF